MLERSHCSSLQYSRREPIEISVIPLTMADKDLENKPLEILESIGVAKINPLNIHACHRLKNRNNTILRFTTRKIADSALHNRGKLKDLNKSNIGLPADTRLFINESLCQPYKFIFYKIRDAHKRKAIASFNLWKGKLTIKLMENGPAIQISHISDLIENGLADETDVNFFLKKY